jgi:hypothetical protein
VFCKPRDGNDLKKLFGFCRAGLTVIRGGLYLPVRREGNDGNRLRLGCPTAVAVPAQVAGFLTDTWIAVGGNEPAFSSGLASSVATLMAGDKPADEPAISRPKNRKKPIEFLKKAVDKLDRDAKIPSPSREEPKALKRKGRMLFDK